MSCPQTPYQPFRYLFDYKGHWPSFISVDGPELFLSNSPEIISGLTLPANLYKAAYAIGITPKRFRCYISHQNLGPLGGTRNVSLILGATAPVTISNIRWQSDTTADLASMGMCTASAQLYDSYEEITGTITVLGDIVIAQAASAVPIGQTFGSVIEFDAASSAIFGATLQIRTVAYTGALMTVPNSFSAPLTPFVVGHPRGNWPHANGVFFGGSFDVAPGAGPNPLQLICCDQNQIEEQTYNSLFNPSGTTNEGLYGVNLTYRFSLSNSSDGPLNLWAYLMATKYRFQLLWRVQSSQPGSKS
jgi:hypothetical protein